MSRVPTARKNRRFMIWMALGGLLAAGVGANAFLDDRQPIVGHAPEGGPAMALPTVNANPAELVSGISARKAMDGLDVPRAGFQDSAAKMRGPAILTVPAHSADFPAPPSAPASWPKPAEGGPALSQSQMKTIYTGLPLNFEANEGQAGPGVEFLARGKGYTLLLKGGEATLALRSRDEDGAAPVSLLRVGLSGANAAVSGTGMDPLPGKVSYFGHPREAFRHSDLPQGALPQDLQEAIHSPKGQAGRPAGGVSAA